MKSDSNEVLKFSWWDLARAFHFLLDNKRGKYFLYTSVLVLVLFYDLIPTLVIGKTVDFFTNYTPGQSLNVFYFYVGFITITWGVVSFIRLSVKKRLSNIQSDVAYFTRVKGFERLLDFSIGWHDKENTGNKVERIKNGTDTLKQLQHIFSNEVLSQATAIFGVIISFLFIRPYFSLYCVIYILIFLSVQLGFYRKMVEMNNANNILLEKAGGTYFEGLSNILTIKTLGVKDDFKKNVVSREALARDYAIKRVTMMNNKWKLFQVINALSIGGILFLAGQNYIEGAISLGSIFVIYNYFQKLNGAISQSTSSIESLIKCKVSIARMMPIFWDDVGVGAGHLDFPKEWHSLEIKNASFSYPKRQREDSKEGVVDDKESLELSEAKDVGIKNISLKINQFEKIGVVGKSGSGKSTLAKILLGLYRFSEGEYKIGDVNYTDIKHDELTKEITLVLQDSEMFNLSLKENITLMRKYDDELFAKAIAISQLQDVIDKLPDGVDTLIGEKGYRLSGGERQRIGIARAIYKDTQILILDEATSALDSKTEGMIQKAFEENLTKKTVISIAHRISTLKNVDKVIVFENGGIVEEGTFKDLSENANSHFYGLNKNQSSGVAEVK